MCLVRIIDDTVPLAADFNVLSAFTGIHELIIKRLAEITIAHFPTYFK